MLQNATWFPRRRVERLGGGSGVGGEVAVAERGMVDKEGDTGDEGLSREDPLEDAGGIALVSPGGRTRPCSPIRTR